MSGISYNTLVTQIRNYTEVGDTVLTTDILENIILDNIFHLGIYRIVNYRNAE